MGHPDMTGSPPSLALANDHKDLHQHITHIVVDFNPICWPADESMCIKAMVFSKLTRIPQPVLMRTKHCHNMNSASSTVSAN